MAPETPRQIESVNVVPPKVEDHEIYKQAGAMRAKLRIPEDQDAGWREMVRLSLSDIPEPKVKSGPLNHVYMELADQREFLCKNVLLPMLTFVNDPLNREPNSVQSDTVIRKTAQYIDALDVYMQMNQGKNPMQTRLLPPYFATPVGIRPGEAVAVEVAGKILPFQFDIRGTDLPEFPRTLAPDAESVLNAAARYDVKMGMITDAQGKVRTDDAACVDFLRLCKYELKNGQTQWDRHTLDSTKFALRYLQKNQDLVSKFAESRNQNVRDVTLAEALECSTLNSPTGQLMGEVMSTSKEFFKDGKLPDMSDIAEGLLAKKEAFKSQAIEIALAPLAELNPKPDPENFEKDAAAVVNFFRSSGKLDSTQISVDATRENPVPQFMILAINDRVLGSGAQNTIEFLRRSAFVTLDPEDSVNRRITNVLTKLIQEKKITTQEVFEIYYLSESKGAALPAAFKVVSLLKKHGHKYGEPDISIELQAKINAQMIDLVVGSTDDVTALAIDLNMDPIEMQNLKEYLNEAGFKKGADGIKALLANMRESPWTTSVYLGAEFGPYVLGAGITTAAVLKYLNMRKIVEFIDHDDMSTIRKRFGISDTVSDAEIIDGKKKALDCYNKFQRIASVYKLVPFVGRKQVVEAKGVIKDLREGKTLVAEPAPDQSAPAKPVTPLERARVRSATGTVGDALDPASVAKDTASVSPNVASKKAPGIDADPARPDDATTPKKKLTWADRLRGKKP